MRHRGRGLAALITVAAITSAGVAAGLSAQEKAGSATSGPGWGITIDLARRVCFVDTDEDVLWCLDALDNPAAMARGLHAHDLLLDPSGSLVGDELLWDSRWRRWRRGRWEIALNGQRREPCAPTLEPVAEAGLLLDRRGNRYGIADGEDGPYPGALYRLTPGGHAVLVAGGAFGQADGKGPAAGFEAIGAVRWGWDGALYLTDGALVRRVSKDGTVSTLAHALPAGKGEPAPRLLGLDVGPRQIVAADYAGGRLLAVAPGGATTTLYRSDPGWAPTGVVAAGDSLYVLEHPAAGLGGGLLAFWGPHLRVQRLRGGQARILASVGKTGGPAFLLQALGAALLISVAAIAFAWRKDVAAWLVAHRRWLPDHVFHLVAGITLLLALLLLGREVSQPAADAARLGTLALILLVTALGSQLGPGLIYLFKKIGPIEMIEGSPASLREALANIELTIPAEGEEVRQRLLSPSEHHAYEQADLQLSLIQFQDAVRFLTPHDKQRYWERLTQVGTAALVQGNALRAISRLRQVQEQSEGRYEGPVVTYVLGIAYLKASQEDARKKAGFLAKAAQCFRAAIQDAPDHYLAYFQLALVQFDLEEYGSAVTSNQKAIEIRPQFALAKYNLAIALDKANRFPAAWQALSSIAPGDENFDLVAKEAREDSDLAPFRADQRFEELALARANPKPF
jgi:tetratricopeptide (TPR) repeat protein